MRSRDPLSANPSPPEHAEHGHDDAEDEASEEEEEHGAVEDGEGVILRLLLAGVPQHWGRGPHQGGTCKQN